MSNVAEKDCIEVIKPFIAELQAQNIQNVQALGGVASHVLTLEGTTIVPEAELIIAPPDITLPRYRPDGNLRDFDALVLSDDPEQVERVEAIAEQTIGDQLDIGSFYRLRTTAQLDEQRANPALSLAKVWVGDRYATVEDGEVTKLERSLYPFAVDIDPEVLKPWTVLFENDSTMSAPNPAITMANYLIRSLSGLRNKDASKFFEFSAQIEDKSPELIEWLAYGPGASHLRLATLLHTLREPTGDPQPLRITPSLSIEPLKPRDLVDAPELMLDEDSLARRSVVAASRAKSRVVSTYEKSEKAVTWWQKNVEPRIGSILKNN